MSTKLAVQMYTLRERTKTAKELAETFHRVREIGYEAVQLSGVPAMAGDNPEVNAEFARKLLDDHGLRCIATHRSWERLVTQTEAEIEFHKTLNCDFTAIGGLPAVPSEDYETYRTFIREALPVMEKLGAEGIRFGHHNHAREFFRPEKHGRTLEDILIDEAPANLMLELDLYWIDHAGADCIHVLKRCHGRVPVIHIKDKEVIQGTSDTRMAPIGEGNLPWSDIIPACEAAGVRWYAVEQDRCYRDEFDCLKSSYEFLRGFGL
jgi:sugar phosphate isomerase/epimerase